MKPDSSTKLQQGSDQEDFANRWQALHIRGQDIAVMAALAREEMSEGAAQFPERVRSLGGAHWTLARETIADIDAMLQPGLSALQTMAARGQDTTAPALVLWREFYAAREALLSLGEVPQDAEENLVA